VCDDDDGGVGDGCGDGRRRRSEGSGGGADRAGGAVHLQPPPAHGAVLSCPGPPIPLSSSHPCLFQLATSSLLIRIRLDVIKTKNICQIWEILKGNRC
jgi:hypothetical protein